MAVSVRLDPLMEKELELSAKRQGVTKSQFIISALERALGRKDPYKLLMQIKADAKTAGERYEAENASSGYQGDLGDADAMRAFIRDKVASKHGLSS